MSSKDHARRCVKCLTTDGGREVTDTQKLANLLNNQFTSVFATEPDSEPPAPPKYNIPSPMSTVITTVPMVEKRLKTLMPTNQPVPPKVAKKKQPPRFPLFCALFQFSLDSRVVP